MARRIKTSLRKHMGNRTHGGGNKKNRRGKGVRGGVGRAGYHKHKWLHTIKFEGTHQTARGFVSLSQAKRENVLLSEIVYKIGKGEFKQDNGAYGIDLTKKGVQVKVLGNGEFGFKANLKANAFSEGAKRKIEAAGGTVTVAQ